MIRTAERAPVRAQPLSLDERLSLAMAEMDYRIGTTPPLAVAVPRDPTASEVLEMAADVVRERGWIRGRYEADQGVCLVGAVRATNAPPEAQEEALSALLTAIRDRFGDFPTIPSFNDSCSDGSAALYALRTAARRAYVFG